MIKDGHITKSAATDEDILKINEFTLKELTEGDVCAFAVTLCDNEIDRDFERFTIPALEKLKELFRGKTGIFDHKPTTENQTARIYDTMLVVDNDKTTSQGEPYTALRGKAYIVKAPKNEDVIADIEAGIKKEISIGFKTEGVICSVCGVNLNKDICKHKRGKRYNGQVCHAILSNPTDAYEWSFVAVPAQKLAGVVKSYTDGECCGCDEDIRELALAGREYLNSLKEDVIRLSYLSKSGIEPLVLESITDKINCGELKELKRAFSQKVSPASPVLFCGESNGADADLGRFKI